MRYSANLNVIIKAIEKATFHMSRDFIELENLQTNPSSALKFASACYNRVKQVLLDDLLKIRPDYNIIFSDGQKIIKNKDSEYSYVIFPIDGFDNLVRSGSDFAVGIALEHRGLDGSKEAISVAISKVVGGELLYCEKGFGAYLNNRRIRVSKRNDMILVAGEDLAQISQQISGKKFSQRFYGCRILDIAYLASSRIEMAIFEKKNIDLLKPFLLLVREAGGKIIEEEKNIIASN